MCSRAPVLSHPWRTERAKNGAPIFLLVLTTLLLLAGCRAPQRDAGTVSATDSGAGFAGDQSVVCGHAGGAHTAPDAGSAFAVRQLYLFGNGGAEAELNSRGDPELAGVVLSQVPKSGSFDNLRTGSGGT